MVDMDNYTNKLEELVNKLMKQYDLSENDVSVGNAAQIKGYIMGLKRALSMARESNASDDNQNCSDNVEKSEYESPNMRRRTRRSRI